MAPSKAKKERPRSGRDARLGDERYRLIRDAFAHTQAAIRAGHYIEAISVLESILADRLGSLLYGVTRQTVELDQTIGNLLHNWQNPPKPPASGKTTATRPSPLSRPLPSDVATFLLSNLKPWVKARNNAVHAMAKLQQKSDLTFVERHQRLESVALDGVRLLRRLDELDRREKAVHGRIAATEPHALRLDGDIEKRLLRNVAPAS